MPQLQLAAEREDQLGAAGRPYLENNQALLYNLFNSLLFAYERGAIHPCKTQIQ